MKSLSMFKKFRLAFRSTGILMRLFFIYYGSIPMIMLSDDGEDAFFLRVMGIICAGLVAAAINMMISTTSISSVALYKTMPMNHKDIADVMVINTIITSLLMAAMHTMYLLFIAVDMILTFICADFVVMALSLTFIPWFMVDKYAANANAVNRENKDDEKTAKKNVIRVGFTSAGIMVVFAAIYCFVLVMGYKNPQNFALFAGFAVVALAIMIGAIIFARRIKYPFSK